MKLNLLPTYVTKEKLAKTAWVFSGLIMIVGLVIALGLTFLSQKRLKDSREGLSDLQNQAAAAVATSAEADDVLAQAQGIIRDTSLAEAMLQHNSAYPDLYDSVKRYIPPYFRVTSMSAAPIDETTSTVTLVGVLQNYQQYADLMLALMRMHNPDVVTVARSGFVDNVPMVPALSEQDQIGAPRRANEGPVPTDVTQRLQYLQSQAQSPGYAGVGGFGSGQPGTRGAMPDWSQVTVNLVVKRDLQVPDARRTLAESAAGAAATGGQPFGAGGPPIGAPAGPPVGAPGGPPGGGAGREEGGNLAGGPTS